MYMNEVNIVLSKQAGLKANSDIDSAKKVEY